MKFFSLNKNQAAVLTTLMILIVLGSVYFFVYVPNNEKNVQAQRFQALQNIDKNVHTKVETSVALLNVTLTGYVLGNPEEKQRLAAYIADYPKTNFTLSFPQLLKSESAVLGKDSLNLNSAYTLKADNDVQLVRLVFNKRFISDTDTAVYSISMEFSYNQFFSMLLPRDIFDEYIVFSNEKPVFETFPAGISSFMKDTLLGINKGVSGAGIRSYTIAGVDYKFFLQPVRLISENEWVIGGLLSNKNFQDKKNQLPAKVVLLLVTIVLIILVSLPWLKLYQMGSKDRLTLGDGVASVLISMLLMSILFFLFFHYNNDFRPGDNNDPKKVIADQLHGNLLTETALAYNTLSAFDSLLVQKDKDIVNLSSNSIAYANQGGPADSAEKIKSLAGNMSINQVFWLDTTGYEIVNWTSSKLNSPHGTYANRSYFKNVIDGNDYALPGKKDPFYLDQVISWTSYAFTSVLTKKSVNTWDNKKMVACLSFNVKSLVDCVLPAGYHFGIIDNGGKVLYHSDKSRNLNENLLSKFSNNAPLRSCIDAQAPGLFSTVYYDKKFNVAVQPVKGLPYFIVVFEDTVYDEIRIMENYSFTFSMLTLLFAFLVVQLLAIFIVSAKRSFFKKQLFDTSWIGPKASCNKEYTLAAVINFFVIALLMVIFPITTFLCYLFMLLFATSFIPLFLTFILARRYTVENKSAKKFKQKSIISLVLLVIILDVIAFKLLDLKNTGWLFLFELSLLLAGLAAWFFREAVYKTFNAIYRSRFSAWLSFKWDYVNSFSLMTLSRLIITSGIPVVFFYYHSYNYEQNIGLRYRQVDFARHLTNKFHAKPGYAENIKSPLSGAYGDGSSIDQFTVGRLPDRINVAGYTEEEENTLRLLRQFRLRLKDKAVSEDRFYNPAATDSSFFFNHLLNDGCNNGKGSVLYGKIMEPDKYLIISSRCKNYKFPTIGGQNFNGPLFWVLLIMALVVFYFIVHTIIRKLFALGLPDIDLWKALDNNILSGSALNETLFVIGLPGSGKKRYIEDKIKGGAITLDDGTAIKFEDPDISLINGFVAELINIPSSANEKEETVLWKKYTKKIFDAKHRFIIVNHFEYNIQDPVSNHYKLDFLEKLFLDSRCKIIILSTIHPVAFLDSMDHFNQQDNKMAAGQDLERWHVLLGHYRIIVMPIYLGSNHINPEFDAKKFIKGKICDLTNHKPVLNASVRVSGPVITTATTDIEGVFYLERYTTFPCGVSVSRRGYKTREVMIVTADELNTILLEQDESFISTELILNETSNTNFLKQVQGTIFDVAKHIPEAKKIAGFDELAFKLQITSHYFYMYIWQSLTKEEKFLLYDLAEDNLVNSFDDYNLSMLLSKGVIIRRDGTIRIFNKGFRNFILSAIGNSEAMKIKNQIKENGNWNKLKSPLQIIIIAILMFLFASQEEAFSKLITYVAALGAGIPAVLKLFSLFDKGGQKQS